AEPQRSRGEANDQQPAPIGGDPHSDRDAANPPDGNLRSVQPSPIARKPMPAHGETPPAMRATGNPHNEFPVARSSNVRWELGGKACDQGGTSETLERTGAADHGFAPIAQPLADLRNQRLLSREYEQSLHPEHAEPGLVAGWRRFSQPRDYIGPRRAQ